MPAGIIPAPITLATAFPAFRISSKAAMTTWAFSGIGISFTVISVTIPSIPSLPVISANKS